MSVGTEKVPIMDGLKLMRGMDVQSQFTEEADSGVFEGILKA